MNIKLNSYKKKYVYKKNLLTQILWYIINNLLINSCFPSSKIRVFFIKLFGGKVGKNVVIKPYVSIKFAWNLNVGDNSWIGSNVIIDNLARVVIENDVCISQGVYFCTGNHNFNSENFDLIEEEILISKHSWIAAKSIIGPGAKIEKNSFVKLGQIITAKKDT